jgi:hypothetical protein
MLRPLTALLLALSSLAAHADAPTRVLILGSYHMGNPGQDMINVRAADVLTPERQQQIEAVVDGLASFKPTHVAVEMPAEQAAAAWPRYLAGELAEQRSEAIQIGFRLARREGLGQVHGIDVPGPFPMDAVMAYAMETGQMAAIQGGMAEVMARSQHLSTLSETDIAAALRLVNQRDTLAGDHGRYMALLRFGEGDRQPGVELMAAWTQRNLGMCARLVQQLAPGDRAFLLVGSSHVEPIRDCLRAIPGIEVVDGIEYL